MAENVLVGIVLGEALLIIILFISIFRHESIIKFLEGREERSWEKFSTVHKSIGCLAEHFNLRVVDTENSFKVIKLKCYDGDEEC